jgi:hypothetical protein
MTTTAEVVVLPELGTIRTTAAYDALLDLLYLKAKRRVRELVLPPIPVLAVTGKQPPGSSQYQQAIAALYGIGYSLRMGLKFGKLPKPDDWFDYRVGALETLWWSTGERFAIDDPETLRWQACLMVPAFVTPGLVELARTAATRKQPGTDYRSVELTELREGRVVQLLHVGPYDQEQPTLDELHRFLDANGLVSAGKHHEIYLSDPRRTPPERIRTVIRLPARPAA